MFNVVMVNPKIPQNVGTIGRTCVALDANLHIILPIPFEISDKQVKRAGLDYWQQLKLYIWDDIDSFWSANPISERHFFATTKTKKPYFEFELLRDDYFYFGSEDSGLPMSLMQLQPDNMFTLPMTNDARSLNVSNAVSVVLYDALRQNFNLFKG